MGEKLYSEYGYHVFFEFWGLYSKGRQNLFDSHRQSRWINNDLDKEGHMPTPIIAANWKMHMTRSESRELIEELKKQLQSKTFSHSVVIAPPFTAIEAVAQALSGTGWYVAAQNVFWEEAGAYTGEISPVMLREAGCRFVIVGHSERRHLFQEADEWVAKKFQAVIRHRMVPILCVGETLEEREREQTFGIVERQLGVALEGFEDKVGSEWVIAYEPVWAIGTGKTATPEQAQDVHATIRQWVTKRFSPEEAKKIPILYGGSVKPENIRELMDQSDIDGALVGGASLKAKAFAKILDF
jgi:triosephosphate isomerase